MPNFPQVDMAIAEPPDRFFRDPEPRRMIRNMLLSLADYDGSHDYAYCWGYTIFRTVYTEGSDEAFAEAIKRLNIYAKIAVDEDILSKPPPNEEPNDPLPNQDVWNRYYCEIVEDSEKLANASVEEVGQYFDTWVKEHLRPVTGRRRPPNTRFELCIMLDQESIDNILLMPEKLSPRDDPGQLNHWVKMVTDEDNPEEGGRLWFRVAIWGNMWWDLWLAWQDPDFLYEEVFWVSEEDGVWNHRPPPGGY